MSKEIIFIKMAEDFASSVVSLRKSSESACLRGISTRLNDARRQVHREVTHLGAKPGTLTVSNCIQMTVLPKGFTSTLNTKLGLKNGLKYKEFPVTNDLKRVLPEEFFRHICVESYRLAKEENGKYFTGEDLQERFVDQLNNHLPEDSRLGLSGTIFNPHTPSASFNLVLTDLVE
ncbi:hypothetical protein [Photobacterium phage PDCC-1]|uniref:Uncharacterized protein n=2 Tax=Aphroditevirus TaxID=2560092 RepID=A0A6B9J2D8_9CAUD|nr:hypothetical protein HWC03_gp099 [Vibrio phage 2 TSL-2019]YP_009853469.1 hypothetical protein HWC77_gp117 [Photobacterium phage PDCC-1]QAU04254.1 hypothetical protein [Vibrio phage 2 TSL-2019]QGZ14480.1 hypothetical protein [Photobacterium phage PDCC-1]